VPIQANAGENRKGTLESWKTDVQ